MKGYEQGPATQNLSTRFMHGCHAKPFLGASWGAQEAQLPLEAQLHCAEKPSGPQQEERGTLRPAASLADQLHTSLMDLNLPPGSSSCKHAIMPHAHPSNQSDTSLLCDHERPSQSSRLPERKAN